MENVQKRKKILKKIVKIVNEKKRKKKYKRKFLIHNRSANFWIFRRTFLPFPVQSISLLGRMSNSTDNLGVGSLATSHSLVDSPLSLTLKTSLDFYFIFQDIF